MPKLRQSIMDNIVPLAAVLFVVILMLAQIILKAYVPDPGPQPVAAPFVLPAHDDG